MEGFYLLYFSLPAVAVLLPYVLLYRLTSLPKCYKRCVIAIEKWLLYNPNEQLNVFLQLFCHVGMKPESLGEFIQEGRESNQMGQSRNESWELAAQTNTELPI